MGRYSTALVGASRLLRCHPCGCHPMPRSLLAFPPPGFPLGPLGALGMTPALLFPRLLQIENASFPAGGPRSAVRGRGLPLQTLCFHPTSVASFTHHCHLESLANLRMEFVSLCLDGGLETHPGRWENRKTHLVCLFVFSF